MTPAEFRKFKTDWSVYKNITKIPADQMTSQLYTACDSSVQTSVINTVGDILSLTEEELLSHIESFTTRHSNPAVHRLTFSNLNQSENEAIKSYLVRLKSSAKDCEFECPSCKHDLSPFHVKDQFIRGLHNTALQTDILAKSASLKTLEDVLKHAEAFESAIHDQSTLAHSNPAEAMRLSNYKQQSRQHRTYQSNPSKTYQSNPSRSYQPEPSGATRRDPAKSQGPPHRERNQRYSSNRGRYPCKGCGSQDHPTGDRERFCPAWNKRCNKCGIMGHLEAVCGKRGQEVAEIYDSDGTIMSHVELIGEI